MITRGCFNEEMGRLADATNEAQKEKFDKRLKVYYEILSPLFDNRTFSKACDCLLRTSNGKFPSIHQCIEAARMFIETSQSPKEACLTCGGTGTINAKKDGYKFIFKCARCQNCVASYPVWDSKQFDAGYTPMTDQDIVWDASDSLQLKGLLFLGQDSMAWKKAPPEVREAAMRMKKEQGAKPKPETLMLSESLERPY